MHVAIIPARGGSKRIPRKNIRAFNGQPMLAWSINAALACGAFERVIVSTDDDEIAAIARDLGAEAPFTRPAELANDHATTVAVMAHAADWLEHDAPGVAGLCCIYATAPFIQTEDLQRAAAVFESGRWRFVFSATEYAAPIFRSFRLQADGGVEMFYPEHFETRSQDLPVAYHDAAQFYWAAPATWQSGEPIFGAHSHALVIPRWRVQDIDTEEDWRRAELMSAALDNS